MNKNTNIVVARYNKNVDFIYKIKDNVNIMIYDKCNPTNPYNVPFNKGDEASVYLKYIIDNYDNLPEYTFFMHDDEYAWHHSGSIVDKYYEAKNSGLKYYNVNDRALMSKNNINERHTKILLEQYKIFVEKYIPLESIPDRDNITYRGGAQFLVHKDIILLLPKQFYTDIYRWIETTEIPRENVSTAIMPRHGYFLEWTWHIYWQIYPRLMGMNNV